MREASTVMDMADAGLEAAEIQPDPHPHRVQFGSPEGGHYSCTA